MSSETNDTVSENSKRKQPSRFQPGQSGNPAGKPKGTRHRATEMIETLMAGDADAIARSVVNKAIDGDMTAARLVLDRIAPPRKGRSVTLDLPQINGLSDLAMAQGVVIKAVAEGDISPEEATDISRVLEATGTSIERRDLETRIAALEATHAKS